MGSLKTIAARTLSGAIVGLAFSSVYALYLKPTPLWLGIALLYGFLTGVALATGTKGAKYAMRYLRLDVWVGLVVVGAFLIFDTHALALAFDSALVTTELWHYLYGVVILGSAAAGFIASIREANKEEDPSPSLDDLSAENEEPTSE